MKTKLNTLKGSERWLPVRFVFRKTGSSVLWVDFGAQELSAPFFNQQVKKLQFKSRSTRKTSIDQFLEIAAMFPEVSPSGYICHVTRCGSTLLANAIREAGQCVVFSEAQPLYQILNRSDFRGWPAQGEDFMLARRRLATGLFGLYAALFGKPVAIKGHTIDILQLAKLRELWPEMPILINTRCPIEVLVSNLDKPGDWVRTVLAPIGKSTLFGLSSARNRQLSVEEYSAMGYRDMCVAAKKHMDHNCRVLDYEEINVDTIGKLLNFFNLDTESVSMDRLIGTFATHSKRPQMAYSKDIETKQEAATESLRKHVSQHAEVPYSSLLSCRSLKDDEPRRSAPDSLASSS